MTSSKNHSWHLNRCRSAKDVSHHLERLSEQASRFHPRLCGAVWLHTLNHNDARHRDRRSRCEKPSGSPCLGSQRCYRAEALLLEGCEYTED